MHIHLRAEFTSRVYHRNRLAKIRAETGGREGFARNSLRMVVMSAVMVPMIFMLLM